MRRGFGGFGGGRGRGPSVPQFIPRELYIDDWPLVYIHVG